MTQEIDSACPLCETLVPQAFHSEVPPQNWGAIWLYFHCETCDLIHRNRSSYLNVAEERERYAMHENKEQVGDAPLDEGYLKFLSPILDQVKLRMPKSSKGLDFGCGPGPLLAQQLRLAGFRMNLYDPQFQPDLAPLNQTYDFVTCTEVLEHVKELGLVLTRLLELIGKDSAGNARESEASERIASESKISPKGLFLLTGFHAYKPNDNEALECFRRWHYRRDPTHICFFSERTFRHFAEKNHCEAVFPSRNVALIMLENGTN